MSLVRFIRNTISSGRRMPWSLYMITDVKPAGKLMGSDSLGNKYYEELSEDWGRQRWIEPARADYDPSEIPAEWHTWMHRLMDSHPPKSDKFVARWHGQHTPNHTGTARAYRPYNTTAPKIQSWDGVPTVRD